MRKGGKDGRNRQWMRLLGMILSAASAFGLMGTAFISWNLYLRNGAVVTGFARLSLFFFGVLPMALSVLRFQRGDRARSEGLWILITLLLFSSQLVAAVQTGIGFSASVYMKWKFIRVLLLLTGALALFLDACLRTRGRYLSFAALILETAVRLWWITAVLISSLEAAPYSAGVLAAGLCESGQLFARVLFSGAACCYLLWRRD